MMPPTTAPASALTGKPSQGFMPRRNCKMVDA